MTRLHLILSGAILLATFSGASGAATPSPEELSSAPSTSTIDNIGELAIPDNSSANDFSAPHSKEADDRLTRSDSHLNAGRQLYFKGDLAGARREFDAAVDALLGASESLPDYRRIERRLDEICDLIYRFDVEKLGAGKKQDDTVAFDKAPIDEISHTTFPVDPKLAPKLESELTQTSSGIPLDLTDPVLSYVHFFSTDRGRSILLAGLRRSGRYQPLIQRIFAEEGVPQDLIYLAQAESGFLPRAISYKKAVGMWQFIAGTGATYDLVHTSTFDERFDPEKATRAAAKYLKDLYARYGDWYLAMAAYNCGAGAVDRAIERTGYADYWELLKRHALPKETASYVPIIVAMTIIEKNPKDYGLENIELDTPVQYDTIQVTANTNLNLIADATMQPLSVIRDLNPALLKTIAPSGFAVHVPKGSGQSAQLALATVPAENRQAWRLHHVEAGDTLAAIAKSYHLAPERIIQVNRGADSLEAGDVLLIPAVYHEERPAYVRARTTRTKARSTSRVQTHSKTSVRQASHISASRRVSSQVLHRKAAVRTASLNR
jgi:membrane-bound lytic murein transglycosylase D